MFSLGNGRMISFFLDQEMQEMIEMIEMMIYIPALFSSRGALRPLRWSQSSRSRSSFMLTVCERCPIFLSFSSLGGFLRSWMKAEEILDSLLLTYSPHHTIFPGAYAPILHSMRQDLPSIAVTGSLAIPPTPLPDTFYKTSYEFHVFCLLNSILLPQSSLYPRA